MADQTQATAIHADEQMAQQRYTIETILGGSVMGGLVAAGAATLAIIGLAGLFPMSLVSVGVIGLGGAFLFEGAAIAARISDLLHEVTEGKIQMTELTSGTTGETLAGVAGVTLGILSLLGVMPTVLVPSAVIIFGAALTIGAGAHVRVNAMRTAQREVHPIAQRITHEAVRATTGLQALAGLGGITLGIIALVGIETLILSLVGVLGIAAMFLLTDTAVAGRMTAAFYHHY